MRTEARLREIASARSRRSKDQKLTHPSPALLFTDFFLQVTTMSLSFLVSSNSPSSSTIDGKLMIKV